MRLNKFQTKVIQLWNEHKSEGLIIEAGRQMGKSTLILEIANKEANKNTAVIVYGFSEQATKQLEQRFKVEFGYDNLNVFFINKNNLMGMNKLKKQTYKKMYYLYDEPYMVSMITVTRVPKPNTLKIYTEVKKGIFRFNEDWYDGSTFSDKTMLVKQETMLGEKEYASQFNCCNIKIERN